jgi:hypothetical protein
MFSYARANMGAIEGTGSTNPEAAFSTRGRNKKSAGTLHPCAGIIEIDADDDILHGCKSPPL